MHQDQRIGLALGVLLVGACAALFFRNDNRIAHQTPRLERAKELDDRIAEKSTRPYLKGIEVVEAADRKRSAPESPVQLNWWNTTDPLANRASTEVAKAETTPQVQPIESEQTSPTDSGTTNASIETTPLVAEESTADHSESPIVAASPTERIHVVQKGETLTSIAAKTLGSPNRFPEIFEANQDQLTDPNDVKLGMTLRIPETKASAEATITNRNTDSGEGDRPTRRELISSLPKDDARNGDPTPISSDANRTDATNTKEKADSSQRRFSPSRRLPLPGRAGETNPDPSKPTAGRRLSQLLPDDVDGKVAR